MKVKKKKIIAILGTTASGKTSLGVSLAKKYDGEIISADSRQVYRGMDIGSGKDLHEYGQVKYHLIDVVAPKTEFSLNKYKKQAEEAIEDVLKRKKLPIIVGGTGLYIQALVNNYNLSGVKPDPELRKSLEKKSVEDLFKELKKIKSKFASRLNESDRKNKRRLIRYIELAQQGIEDPGSIQESQYDWLILGLDWPTEILWQRIEKRLLDRLNNEGLVEEVRGLHAQGVYWKRLESFGLEYRFVSRYLQNILKYDEMINQLFIAIRQFSKRQKSWFRRWEKQGQKINWIKTQVEAEKLITKFLK